MEKLELRHIAPYLPYELQFKDPETVVPGVMVSIVAGMPGLLFYEDKNNIEYFDLSAIKPLLIPLKEVMRQENVDKIATWLYSQEGENFDNLNGAKRWVSMMYTNDILNLPYKVIAKLFEMHFDVFRLIDAGLALKKS